MLIRFRSVILLSFCIVCVYIYNLLGILAIEFYFPYVQLFCVPEQFIHILKHLKTAQTHALLCQRGCPPLTYSLCPKLKASTLEKIIFSVKKGIFSSFVCLFVYSFIYSESAATLWSPSGLLSIKMKISPSFLFSLSYFL